MDEKLNNFLLYTLCFHAISGSNSPFEGPCMGIKAKKKEVRVSAGRQPCDIDDGGWRARQNPDPCVRDLHWSSTDFFSKIEYRSLKLATFGSYCEFVLMLIVPAHIMFHSLRWTHPQNLRLVHYTSQVSPKPVLLMQG